MTEEIFRGRQKHHMNRTNKPRIHHCWKYQLAIKLLIEDENMQKSPIIGRKANCMVGIFPCHSLVGLGQITHLSAAMMVRQHARV
jgi:hypothetical protein